MTTPENVDIFSPLLDCRDNKGRPVVVKAKKKGRNNRLHCCLKRHKALGLKLPVIGLIPLMQCVAVILIVPGVDFKG